MVAIRKEKTNSAPLFDGIPMPEKVPVPSPIETRMDAMRAAEEHANNLFKAEYEAFLRRYAEKHDVFASEDVQFAYKKLHYMPQPKEWRASGGITQRLLRKGELFIVGSRKSDVDCRKINLLSKTKSVACPTCGRAS